MRKLLVLCATILCLSLTLAAKDSPVPPEASSPASAPAAPTLYGSDQNNWQLGIGYEFQNFKMLGQSFHNNGFDTDLTYFLSNWFGLEGNVAVGFGTTTTKPNLTANSVFVGGGPHVTIRNSSKFEPWIHALVGLQHFRFTQTSPAIGSDSAVGYAAGLGMDYKITPGMYIRLQADYRNARFAPVTHSNYSVGAGIVFNL